jgi:DNA primase
MVLGRGKLTLTNLSKVLYPSGFIKGQIIDYYRHVAQATPRWNASESREIYLPRWPS